MFDTQPFPEEPLEVTLKPAPDNMGQASLSTIKATFDRIFGEGQWYDLETETISISLGLMFDALIVDKVHVLQLICSDHGHFFEDPMFMLHATEVINNHVADFEHMPTPTSLELAFAITEVQKIVKDARLFSEPIQHAVGFILRHEGYSVPVEPFSFVPQNLLVAGQTREDTAAKARAIQEYISHMESL